MKKTKIVVIGSTLASGLSMTSIQAEVTDVSSNPFLVTELASGYFQLAQAKSDESSTKMKSGSCGEGQCGSQMMRGHEERMVEGHCAGNKPMPNQPKMDEGKCGEGKCGAMSSGT